MLGGAAPASFLLLGVRFFQLITLGECFFVFLADDTCFKAYYCTVTYSIFPHKYVLIYLLFYHCPVVEGSHFFSS